MEEAWPKSKINLRVIITHIDTKFGGVKSLISKFPYEQTDGHVPQLLILFQNIYVIVYGVCHAFFSLLNKFGWPRVITLCIKMYMFKLTLQRICPLQLVTISS